MRLSITKPTIFKRRFARFVAVILGVAVLAVACGKDDAPASGAQTPTPSGTSPTAQAEKLDIATTLFPLEYFTRRIAGDTANVTNIVKPGVDAHDFEPTPGDIRTLANSDIMVYNGAGFEPWIDRAVANLPASVTLVEAAHDIAEQFDDEHGHGDEPQPRIIVADGATGLLQVVDLESGEIVATFQVEGKSSLYVTESGRIAAAVQTAAGKVNFIDSGMWADDHGDHIDAYKGEPSILPFSLSDAAYGSKNPVHFVSHNGYVTVHFDGNFDEGVSSKNLILPERAVFDSGVSPFVLTTEANHGVSVPAARSLLLISDPDPTREFGTLASGFKIVDQQGNTIQTFNDKADPQKRCLGMHGEAVVGDSFLFGCFQKNIDGTGDGGVLVLTQNPATGFFSSKKISYPDNFRTSVIKAHHDQSFAVGQYGVFHNYNALVRIDPAADSINQRDIYTLPANYQSFDFEHSEGDQVVVLTKDGVLRVLDLATWTLVGELDVTGPFERFGSGALPSMVAGHGVAYITIPDTGEIIEVHLEEMEIERTFKVAGNPSAIAIFGWNAPLGPVIENSEQVSGPELDADGHGHGSLDPHVWLDPLKAIELVKVIRDALIARNPASAAAYTDNADLLIADLNALDSRFQTGLATCSKKQVATSHEAFGYMARRYGFEQMAVSGLSPEAEPSPRDLADLSSRIKKAGIQYVLVEPILSQRLAQTVAKEVNATLLPLHPIESVTLDESRSGETYFTLMDKNLTSLKQALGCST
ncbi:MAG: hypothetical protein FJ319_07560 [SAR202 cluster bacterium]|nr:hypothetical protein [SAR202 cluster bacterium]